MAALAAHGAPGAPPESTAAQTSTTAGPVTRVDPGEAELAAASGSRTVRVGSPGASGQAVTVPLEVYVARVLAGEGEPNAGPAAQQALAIAIRTYAIVKAGTHRRDGYDVCDTTHCQVPRASTPASRRAALETVGRILTDRGTPAEVFYSASCGGRSESASAIWSGTDFPYLRTIVDDVHDGDAPWTLEVRVEELQRTLARAGFEGSRLRGVRIVGHTASGRVARLQLPGLRPDVIAGDQFRMLVGASRLRSTAFSVASAGDTLRFTGRGYGHGVGMCVIGAGRRARRGEDATTILATYYPGLTVRSLGGDAIGVGPQERTAQTLPPATNRSARRETTSQPAGPAAFTVPPVLAPASPARADANAGLERLAAAAQESLSRVLGVSLAPVTVTAHTSLESFRAATGRPWWVSASAVGRAIDLAPLPLLAQGEGVETTLRTAIAELLVSEALSDRPVWVRIGAARYFGRSKPIAAPASRPTCPADAELTLAISAAAQREAESRAERCFASAYARTGDWRQVR